MPGKHGLTLRENRFYMSKVIPAIEKKLPNETGKTQVDMYKLYVDLLRMCAKDNFIAFNKYIELDDDKTTEFGGFYHKRQHHLGVLFETLNDMEVYNKYDTLLVSMPPRVGKSVTNLRFISWIIGRHPENTQLAISYSDAITKSFYIGVMEIIQGDRYKQVFPESPLVAQNAKDENIWLKEVKQYPSISFIPINGSMTGRGQGSNYIFYDDLVSGIEEAMSPARLDKLWQTYSTNSRQRKLDGCKEIHIATRWSVHDPMTRLESLKEGDPRFKSIKLPCYDENGESAFDFPGGFSTKYYKDIESIMDELSFGALYLQNPIEREGLLYHEDDLKYYFELPKEKPDAIISVCDSKNLGTDFVSAPIGYVYGDQVYIDDVVFNNGLPDITRPLVAKKWIEHKVARGDVEMNNGGNYFAEDLDKRIREGGGHTSIRTFFTATNKMVKIVTFADFVKEHFVFKHKSLYTPQSEYGQFMKQVFGFTQTGKNTHDKPVRCRV